MLHVSVSCAVLSVPCSLVVTCLERADLLADMCVFLCFVAFPNVSWSTSEIRARLAPQNWFKSSSKKNTDRFKLVLLVWIICVIYVLCLSCFHVCSLLPCGHLLGKCWPLGPCLWCLIVFLSLSHMVYWVRCGTWLYRFLNFAAFLTFILIEGKTFTAHFNDRSTANSQPFPSRIFVLSSTHYE